MATFNEGDYFGEVALLTDQPRTASVVALTDLMLLSLSCADLEAVLAAYPQAAARIEAAAKERVRSIYTCRRGSHGGTSSLLGMGAPSRSNSISAMAKVGGARVRRLSHRLLSLTSEAMPKVVPKGDGESIARNRSASVANVRSATDASGLFQENHQALCSSLDEKVHRRGSQSSNVPQGQGVRQRCAISKDVSVFDANLATPASAWPKRRMSLAARRCSLLARRNSVVSPSTGSSLQPHAHRDASAVSTKRSKHDVAAGRCCAMPTSSGGRRRSVDAGLTFNEHRVVQPLLPLGAVVFPGASRPAPAQGLHHAPGSRKGSVCSSTESLRKSLDCGWDAADDHRRRSSLTCRLRTCDGLPLTGKLDEAISALGRREHRRLSNTPAHPVANIGSVDQGNEGSDRLPEGKLGDMVTREDVTTVGDDACGLSSVDELHDAMEQPMALAQAEGECTIESSGIQRTEGEYDVGHCNQVTSDHVTSQGSADKCCGNSQSPARRTSLSIRAVKQPVAKAAAKFFRERRRSQQAGKIGLADGMRHVAEDHLTMGAPSDTTSAHERISTAHLNDLVASLHAKLDEQHVEDKNALQDLWKEIKQISDKVNQLYSNKWM